MQYLEIKNSDESIRHSVAFPVDEVCSSDGCITTIRSHTRRHFLVGVCHGVIVSVAYLIQMVTHRREEFVEIFLYIFVIKKNRFVVIHMRVIFHDTVDIFVEVSIFPIEFHIFRFYPNLIYLCACYLLEDTLRKMVFMYIIIVARIFYHIMSPIFSILRMEFYLLIVGMYQRHLLNNRRRRYREVRIVFQEVIDEDVWLRHIFIMIDIYVSQFSIPGEIIRSICFSRWIQKHQQSGQYH